MSSGYLLWLVRTGKARTRADLQQHTGLSRSTVQQRLKPLFDHGYLRAHGTEDSTGGRPSVLLEFTDDGVVLVADLDTADARLAVVDLAGHRLAQERIDLEIAAGPVPVLETLDARFRALLERASRPPGQLRGIGVGVPGPVEFETGTVRQPPIMPGWDGHSIAEDLSGRWDVPVLVDNDANIMALGEYTQHHRESSSLILVKVSAGIGSGLVFNGGLLRGVDGGAGDIGHIRLHGYDDAICMCGSRGCLAAVASGGALARRLTERGLPTGSSRELAAHLAAGRPEAVQLAREAGQQVGEVLTTVVCMVNPEVLVIAGDLADTHFVTGVREVIYQKALPRATRHLQVTSSNLGDLAGLYGAQAMVLDAAYTPAAVDARLAREGAS